jgi:predicted metal-dependent enzyme (double-stranded beta helix superfamily)
MTSTIELIDPAAARKHGGLLPQEWHEVTAPPPEIARAAAAMTARYDASTLDTDALSLLVGSLASRTELWKPLVVRDRARRRYRLMLDDDRLDIWVLSWMPGQSTGYHDHGSSNVALAAVQGCVLERQIRVGGASLERELRPGVVQPGPAGYIHSVAHRAGAPAVTLHAYSPPLVQVGQYRAGPQGVLLREQQHGRQELLDHTIEDAA